MANILAPNRVNICKVRPLLYLAALQAAKSTDASTQNGAVIVNHHGVLVPGHNSMLPLEITDELLDISARTLKLGGTAHAEEAVICSAAHLGVATAGATMYSLWFPCAPCARLIINAGIKKVVGLRSLHEDTPERWLETVTLGSAMLDQRGVERVLIDMPLGVTITFNGEERQI